MPSEWFSSGIKGANKQSEEEAAATARSAEEAEERALIRIRDRLASMDLAGMPEDKREEEARRIILLETSSLTRVQRETVEREVLQYLGGGLGPLQQFMDDPDVTEIMVNHHKQVYVERNGQIELTDAKFRNDEEVRSLVERLVSSVGRNFSLSEPMVDARLPATGSRLNAVMPPLAVLGTAVTIRKFPRSYTFQELVDNGTIPS